MTSVSSCFARLRSQQQCALIPFITAGDPDLATTAEALKVLDANGADIIELGVPYADPLADGPVIQAAATRALQAGTTLDKVIDMIAKIAPELRSPIVLFTYYNPILHRGIENFLEKVAGAGVKGLVVPDLPLEEAASVLEPAKKVGIELILLVAPTSPMERIEAIAQKAEGFIYLVSVIGVTGERSQVETRVEDLLQKIRTVTDKPVGVGFGISQPEQAKQMRDWGADGVIVGSAFVKLMSNGTPPEALQAIGEYSRKLKEAIS